MAQKVRKGDFVRVIAGSAKGKEGLIASVCGHWITIEGVKMVLKHHKPKAGEQGRLDTFPGNIHISNVQHCIDNKVTRVGFKSIDGKKMLISKSTGKEIRKV